MDSNVLLDVLTEDPAWPLVAEVDRVPPSRWSARSPQAPTREPERVRLEGLDGLQRAGVGDVALEGLDRPRRRPRSANVRWNVSTARGTPGLILRSSGTREMAQINDGTRWTSRSGRWRWSACMAATPSDHHGSDLLARPGSYQQSDPAFSARLKCPHESISARLRATASCSSRVGGSPTWATPGSRRSCRARVPISHLDRHVLCSPRLCRSRGSMAHLDRHDPHLRRFDRGRRSGQYRFSRTQQRGMPEVSDLSSRRREPLQARRSSSQPSAVIVATSSPRTARASSLAIWQVPAASWPPPP